MNNSELTKKDYQLYLLKSLLWLGLAWGGFVLTQIGFFHAWIVWAIFLLAAFLLAKSALSNNFSLKPSKEMFLVGTILFIVVIFFSSFSTPTVFTGRDQGSFAEAAVHLSQNHKLEFSTPTSDEFFKLRQSGRSLNFPGFYYTLDGELITQFSLAYISWLALFFSIFGIAGFVIANAVLLYAFFFSFYLLTRLFLKNWSTVPTMLFLMTSFVFMWFSKMTLSENIALPLLWTGILALTMFLKNQKMLYYLVFLLCSFLLIFARIEGIAFLVVAIGAISLNKEAREYVKQSLGARFLLPLFLFIVFFALNAFNDVYFYKEIAKAILPTFGMPKAKYLGDIKNLVLPSFYLGKVLYIYGLLGFFLVGGVSIAIKLWRKDFHKLIPFLITLPTFIYFVDDHISPDHPWLLRRFMFSLLPVAILYTGLTIGRWLENRQSKKMRIAAIFLTIVLLAGNLPAFLKYFTFSENKNLLAQTESLSTRFSKNDLVLVDQTASGDGWSMISGPLNFLHGKNAIYFFNIQDLAKLDTSKFENIYLIASNERVSYYLNSTIGSRLSQSSEYELKTSRLSASDENPLGKIMLPEKKELLVQGKIFKVSK